MKGEWVRRAGLTLLAALLLVLPAPLLGKGGVYRLTKHADPSTGVYRDTNWNRGECAQCHTGHPGNAFALFAPNDNALCYTCHGATTTIAVYQGRTTYDGSSHRISTSMVWPGADSTVDANAPRANTGADAGKCINCHDPHGYDMDGTGLIPSLAFSREERLCYVCHDGSPALKNVKGEFAKQSPHPITTSGRHSVAERGTPSAYAATPANNRHAECADCHNPHADKSDGTLTPPTASNRLLGVGRVAVSNGAAGMVPTYTYRGPGDAAPVLEYEICFKCHSSWTTLPTVLSSPYNSNPKDKAVQFNTNNRSYHPVEGAGKNTNINPNAFVNGWTAARTMFCTDCHTSDNTSVRGPHGSAYAFILKQPYTASGSSRTMSSGELCFGCHRYDTYANRSASGTVQGYSRFPYHTLHVDAKQRPCYACHDSHGSPSTSGGTSLAHLIVTGRSPGITSYTDTTSGATCQPSCHGSKTYTVNYPR